MFKDNSVQYFVTLCKHRCLELAMDLVLVFALASIVLNNSLVHCSQESEGRLKELCERYSVKYNPTGKHISCLEPLGQQCFKRENVLAAQPDFKGFSQEDKKYTVDKHNELRRLVRLFSLSNFKVISVSKIISKCQAHVLSFVLAQSAW